MTTFLPQIVIEYGYMFVTFLAIIFESRKLTPEVLAENGF